MHQVPEKKLKILVIYILSNKLEDEAYIFFRVLLILRKREKCLLHKLPSCLSITRLKCRQSLVSEKPRTGHETRWGSLLSLI